MWGRELLSSVTNWWIALFSELLQFVDSEWTVQEGCTEYKRLLCFVLKYSRVKDIHKELHYLHVLYRTVLKRGTHSCRCIILDNTLFSKMLEIFKTPHDGTFRGLWQNGDCIIDRKDGGGRGSSKQSTTSTNSDQRRRTEFSPAIDCASSDKQTWKRQRQNTQTTHFMANKFEKANPRVANIIFDPGLEKNTNWNIKPKSTAHLLSLALEITISFQFLA